VSFARAGQRVIIVSGDLRRPRIHNFFDAPNDSGLTSIILGELSADEALHEVTGEPRLRVLASGPIPPNPAEVLSLERVRTLIDTIAMTADIVLIDCPPVLPVTDALLISRLVDGMLIVASAGNTKKRDLERACELLRQVGAPLLGTVLNRVPPRAGYGYDYGYYYSHGYGEQQGKSRTPKGHPLGRTPIADEQVSGNTSAFEGALENRPTTDKTREAHYANGHILSTGTTPTSRNGSTDGTSTMYGAASVQTRIADDLREHRPQATKPTRPSRWSWLRTNHS
jgi:capsular exopolysaccharide synthesis family protein